MLASATRFQKGDTLARMLRARWFWLFVVISIGCVPRPHEMFTCGATRCDSATQYCAGTFAAGAATPTEACAALPSACASDPSCECMTTALQATWMNCYCDQTYGCTLVSGAAPGGSGGGGAGGGAADAGSE